ncbi:hypothetical protein GO730_39235 [Spirosoma sp. HMF3257]|uniref:Uncharacterized protein n=1 Tax=Spirosoma telluris TaxID=2183553 RepID=A0A327NDB6_9BACT|nr:hypothetical protein [Spirosoma telluris]RAI72925.1 hypothetical protein HMF3257_39170 [Spirosoma telluris]
MKTYALSEEDIIILNNYMLDIITLIRVKESNNKITLIMFYDTDAFLAFCCYKPEVNKLYFMPSIDTVFYNAWKNDWLDIILENVTMFVFLNNITLLVFVETFFIDSEESNYCYFSICVDDKDFGFAYFECKSGDTIDSIISPCSRYSFILLQEYIESKHKKCIYNKNLLKGKYTDINHFALTVVSKQHIFFNKPGLISYFYKEYSFTTFLFTLYKFNDEL